MAADGAETPRKGAEPPEVAADEEAALLADDSLVDEAAAVAAESAIDAKPNEVAGGEGAPVEVPKRVPESEDEGPGLEIETLDQDIKDLPGPEQMELLRSTAKKSEQLNADERKKAIREVVRKIYPEIFNKGWVNSVEKGYFDDIYRELSKFHAKHLGFIVSMNPTGKSRANLEEHVAHLGTAEELQYSGLKHALIRHAERHFNPSKLHAHWKRLTTPDADVDESPQR